MTSKAVRNKWEEKINFFFLLKNEHQIAKSIEMNRLKHTNLVNIQFNVTMKNIKNGNKKKKERKKNCLNETFMNDFVGNKSIDEKIDTFSLCMEIVVIKGDEKYN